MHMVYSSTLFRLTEDELKGMIDEADRDGNGLVSRDEFIAVMQRTALFS